jgi:hypothetical protein
MDSSKLAPNTDNLLLGKGSLYFSRLSEAEVATGELHLGNAPSFEFTLSQTMKDHFTSMEGIKKKDKSIATEEKVSGKFTLEEFSKENLLIALRGDDLHYITQTAGATAVLRTAFRDRWLDVGYRSISNVVVFHGGTTFTVNVDYKIYARVGRIMPLYTGAIYEGEQLSIQFNYASINQPSIRMSQRDVKGYLRFVPNNDQGPQWMVEMWRVNLKCDSGLGFITEDWGKMDVTFEADDDKANHPDEPYGRVTELKSTTVIS